jgi:phosphohistidine phosphatase
VKIIIIRHAAAIDRDGGIADGRRYITPKGRVFFRETARTIIKKGIEPDLILTSPLLRAVQTADILAESLEYNGPLAAVDELEPGFDLSRLQRLLDRYPHAGELIIVGHEPDLSSIVCDLLGLPNGFSFKKGSAIRLNVEPADPRGSAVFKWLAVGRELIASREVALQ